MEALLYDCLISGGQVITPNGPVMADLALTGDSIAAIGHGLTGKRVIDATGCYLLPGGVDPHVHLQLALGGLVSSDSFASGTIAAACGGTTMIVDFADPQPGQSMADALAARRAEADGQVAVDYGLHMTIPTWHAQSAERLLEVPALVAAGCATFKLYQAYARMELDDIALHRSMAAVGQAGGAVVLHSETGPLLDYLRAEAVAAGHTAAIWHERTRPARLEATAIHRAGEIAHLTGCPVHIFHIGCAEGVAEVVAARSRGVAISGESCPHYLLLTAEEHLGGPDGNLYICAPPLRSAADQSALWQALAQGGLDLISTDHCPWTQSEKCQRSFAQVPGGVPGIEARLSLIHHFGVNGGHLSLAQWVELCATAPARRMGLTRKGSLLPGFDADIVLFDPHREKTISTDTLHESAGWTPFAGMTVTGWPRTVLLRGRVIVENEEFVGSPGDGRFVRRSVKRET
ncbi:MAG: dihydropyrimidinase [Caldilineaceae bacterium]|nr:dihydropyrimidinase [Caldilineaceae bacterium]